MRAGRADCDGDSPRVEPAELEAQLAERDEELAALRAALAPSQRARTGCRRRCAPARV